MKSTVLTLLLSLCYTFGAAFLLAPQVEAQTLGAPTSLTASNTGSKGFTVSWTAPSTTLTITGYDVRYKSTLDSSSTYVNANHTGTDTTVTLTGLTPSTPYRVEIRTVAGTAKSEWTPPMVQTTLSALPLDAPTGLTVSSRGSTKFTVSWTAPTATSGLTITGYDIRYRIATSGTHSEADHTGTSTSVTITGLTANTSYIVQIRAVSGDEVGIWSTYLTTSTLSIYPINPPTSLTVSSKGSTKFTVSWTAPTPTNNLTITGYDVRYWISTSSTFLTADHSGTGTSVTITGLTANTTYATQVRTLAGDEESSWSDPVYTATLSSHPINPPTGLTVSNTESTGFTVSWTAPTPTNNLTITGYDVRYRISTSSTYSTADHSGTGTSVTITGLTANTAYATQVRTLAGDEESVWSAAVYAATLTSSPIDTVASLNSGELSQLSALLTYDTLIINELHNGSDDANDWLELRNVSAAAILLDTWQLTILTGQGKRIVGFPAGNVIPAGDVLLLTNAEMATADTSVSLVVAETFMLPQVDFAITLRSPTTFGDLIGNYVQGESERPEIVPAFTVDTVWDRTQPFGFGYLAEAWAKSTYQNGLGSPGYLPTPPSADLNNDGVVNIFDLVLVASQFGTTSPTADLNNDGTVNIGDLAIVAGALSPVGIAPTANQSAAAVVNDWLRLARENASNLASTSIPEGFSYQRGIAMLEQLARALTPDTTALLANYPNPFNPETWIPYQLSKATDVTLTIYASDAGVVRTLALGTKDAGIYKTRSQAAYWDGKNETGESVSSGIYFYTLTAGDFSATRKMLILK